MRDRFLTIAGMMLLVPALHALVSAGEQSSQLAAYAAPQGLIDGCGDVPEVVALVERLRLRELRIESYMESLRRKEEELRVAEQMLTRRLNELKAAKATVGNRKTYAQEAVDHDIDRLVSVYGAMKPAEAAQVLVNLPADFAAEILMRVAPDTGARIMAAVEPNQAAVLTAHMGARSAGKLR